LARRVVHALDIAEQAVDLLSGVGYKDESDPGNDVLPEKVISETAFLLLALSATPGSDEIAQRVRHLAERLIPSARSERMFLGMCLKPSLAVDFALAHICLERLGYSDSTFDAVLRESLNSLASSGHERTPSRDLEREWLLRTWKGSGLRSDRRFHQLARLSALGRSLDLLGGSRNNFYAFTHALIYVRDFNLAPLPLPRPTAAVLADAEGALAGCLDDEDYDLGAEVLLAWPLTRRRWSVSAAFGFRVLTRVEDEAGFLPSPATRLERINEMTREARAQYLLATSYHTVYVMGLLCAATLQTRLSQAPQPRGRAGISRRLVRFLDQRGAHWREEFERLSPSDQDSLSGFVLAVALRQQARRHEFGAIRDLLEIGYEAGLADCPIASQAAELLGRIAAMSPALIASRWATQYDQTGAGGITDF
jgi:hypothetical protein